LPYSIRLHSRTTRGTAFRLSYARGTPWYPARHVEPREKVIYAGVGAGVSHLRWKPKLPSPERCWRSRDRGKWQCRSRPHARFVVHVSRSLWRILAKTDLNPRRHGQRRTLLHGSRKCGQGRDHHLPCGLAAQCASDGMNSACTEQADDDLTNLCQSAFEATVATGGACHTDYECAGAGVCYNRCDVWDTTDCCTGTCNPSQPTTSTRTFGTSADGEPCASSGPRCAYITSYCDSASAACKARRPVGAPCNSSDACILYASCVHGQCQKRPELGESCSQTAIADLPCQIGSCDDSTNRCATTTAMKICF
jgi:hypothetical protein